jgi:drug/metabolite transporter (DMT)-like permease
MRGQDVARLLVLAALWGGSFLFVRVAVPTLGPIALIAARVGMAGVALLAYASATRQELALRQFWRQYLIIGIVNSALPFVLIATAELHLTASLAAILNATSPLFGALVAALWLGEPLTGRKLAGLGLGLLGVSIVVGWSPLTLSPALLGAILASLGGAVAYGVAGSYTKRHAQDAPALGMAVGSQLAATLVLAPLLLFAWPARPPSPAVVACVLALALASTALAYVLYFRLIVDIGPLRALTVTFLTPVFGVAWGILFLSEPLSPSTLMGSAVILLGTALVTGLRLPRRRDATLRLGQ